ncbi:MAG: TetR/AcrR family transcriptional regulator [Syntrophaceae bacterium]|nr:TetR/AcrR family transcriptional regulator [Syntrophaceae bacterium]
MARIDTKERILIAATEIIYEKGYHGANIAEIAAHAGISPSALYKHYRDKQDLLFSIAARRAGQYMERAKHDLQAIEGSENLLRKLVWSLMDQYQKYPKYSVILQMECRSNKLFYQTEAYYHIKEFGSMFIDIFEAGKNDGEFDPNSNSRLVRDLLFGAIDYSVLSCLVLKEISEITDDVPDIFRLFKNMTRKYPDSSEEQDNKKQRLLNSAIKVFSQKGYYEATISEIAGNAGVSDGILYEYFENKEDLLLSIADREMTDDVRLIDKIFSIGNAERKLRRFIEYRCENYLTKPDYLKVYLLLISTNRKFYDQNAYKAFKQYNDLIVSMVKEGQDEGVFDPDINPRIFRNMLMGGINHVLLRWLIVPKGTEPDKAIEIEEVTNLLISSVRLHRGASVYSGAKRESHGKN